MTAFASKTALAAAILLTGLSPSALQGAAVIHESFADKSSSVSGNTPSAGLAETRSEGGTKPRIGARYAAGAAGAIPEPNAAALLGGLGTLLLLRRRR